MHVNMHGSSFTSFHRVWTQNGRSRTIGMYSCLACTGPEEHFNVELKTTGAFLSYDFKQNR